MAELPGILVSHTPPLRVADARWLAEPRGPEIIEGCDLVEAVRDLRR